MLDDQVDVLPVNYLKGRRSMRNTASKVPAPFIPQDGGNKAGSQFRIV
jgi:hypothetical protein